MFAHRFSLQLKPNKFAEFTKTFESDVLPLLRRQSGFRDEITFAAPDVINVQAVSLWETQKDADDYGKNAHKDVLKKMEGMTAGAPNMHKTTEVMHSTFHQIRPGQIAA